MKMQTEMKRKAGAMMKNVRLKPLVIAVVLPLVVGALSSFLTRGSMERFKQLRQPPLTPPDWVFPVVWSALYVLMGVASYLVWTADAPWERKRITLAAYIITLILNFCWPLLFFRAGIHLLAFIWLIGLWGMIAATLWFFWRLRRSAGLMLLPYLLWTAFAGYLNWGVYWLNR